MRPPLTLLIFLGALAVSALVWLISGGHAVVFLLPLLVGPLLFRRRT